MKSIYRCIVFALVIACMLSWSEVNVALAASSTLSISSPSKDDVFSWDDNITVSWGEVTDAVGYYVSVKDMDTNNLILQNRYTTSTSMNISSYVPSKYACYYIWVGAVNSADKTGAEAFTADDVYYVYVSHEPDIENDGSSNVTTTSATLSMTISKDYGYSITDYGFYIGTSSALSKMEKYSYGATSKGSKTVTITGLTPGKKYYYRAFAENLVGEEYSAAKNFTTNSDTFYIFYDANGGTGAPDEQTKQLDVDIQLSTTIPVRSGYTFKGWATSKSSTTVKYASGATYSANADLDLYAVWEADTYTVTYNANGGSNAPASQTKTHDSPLVLTSSVPTRAGYDFMGWSSNSSATSAEYTSGASYTNNASVTLFAVWKAKTYTISFDANGGSGAPATQIKTHGVTLVLSNVKPIRSGYSFVGWSTNSSASSASYTAGGNYTGNSNVTLYAVWKVKDASKKLVLPASLQEIEEEAFYGAKMLDMVVLPSGIKKIRSHAFADSTLTEINLPSSLTFIADDAFAGSDLQIITAAEGTYAYEWAVASGYISVPISTIIINEDETEWWIGRVISAHESDFVTIQPANATDKTLSWYSTDTSVVMVSVSSHIVTIKMVGLGEANIIAEASDGVRGVLHVSVVQGNPPAAPTQNASTASANTVTVSWNAVSGADSYTVFYNTTNSISSATSVLAGSNTSITLTDLAYSKTYYTWVKASNNAGFSEASAVKSVKTGSLAKPATPTLESISTSGNTITITWNRVSGASKYTIYYGTSTSTLTAKSVNVEDITSYTLTGLAYNKKYYVWLKARNSTGTSSASSNLSITTDPQPSNPVAFNVVHDRLSGSILTMHPDAGENDYCTLSITSNTAWTASLTNNTSGFINLVKADTSSATISSTTSASGAADTTLNLRLKIMAVPAAGTTSTATLAFTVGTQHYSYTIQLSKPAVNQPIFSGSFTNRTKTITLGQSWIVEGTVSVSNGTLGRVTVNSDDGAGFSLTEDFQYTGYDNVGLQYWAAYTIDTTKAPFNTPGTYMVNLWAKDANGVGGTDVLDTMTLEIRESTNLKTSAQGQAFIKAHEGGPYLTAYNDGYGTLTIGWGHTSGVTAGMTITEAQAQELFEQDLKTAEGFVDTFAINNGITFTTNQYDALVDMCLNLYNQVLGSNCRLTRAINNNLVNGRVNMTSAVEKLIYEGFATWHHASGTIDSKGLYNRRMNEARLFCSGNYARSTSWATPSWLINESSGPEVPDGWYPEELGVDIDITSVSLSNSSISLEIGDAYSLTASPLPNNATVTTSVSWKSSNTSIAKVGANTGKVTAVATGTATITATMTSSTGTVKTATCSVTVTDVDPTPTQLSAPSRFAFTGITKNAVSVSFNAVSGASGYYVYYSTSSTFKQTYNKVSASYNDGTWGAYVSGLSSGTRYYFWAAAYDSNGKVGETASLTTITASVAITVKNKDTGEVYQSGQIYDYSLTSINLTWTVTSGNGTQELKSFAMTREPYFDGSDASYIYTSTGVNGYYYGSSSSAESNSTWTSLPISFADVNAGKYIKVWIGARDANYSTNGVVVGIQFALRVTSPSITPVVIHPDDTLTTKLNSIKEILKPGYYWTSSGSAVTIAYGNQSVTTHVSSTKKCSSHENGGVKSTCESFNGSYQCAGYARLIGWALTGNDPYASTKVEAQESNRASLVANLAPGDIVRVGNDRHTFMVIDTDSTNIYVTDCNWDWYCGIRWDGVFTREALSSNGGTGKGEAGRNRLCHVYKYSNYK